MTLPPNNLPSIPLEFVMMEVLEPLLKRLRVNQFVLVMKDLQTKESRAFSMSKTTFLHITSLLVDKLAILHGFPKYVWTDYKSQFIKKCFEPIRSLSGNKIPTTTAYYPQKKRASREILHDNNHTTAAIRG